jgi:hypothetical protein
MADRSSSFLRRLPLTLITTSGVRPIVRRSCSLIEGQSRLSCQRELPALCRSCRLSPEAWQTKRRIPERLPGRSESRISCFGIAHPPASNVCAQEFLDCVSFQPQQHLYQFQVESLDQVGVLQ